MKYIYNKNENYFKLQYDNNINIIINPEQLINILNSKKIWKFDESNKYPYYINNYKQLTILQFLFNFKANNIIYKFKNGNKYDLREKNVKIFHEYHNIISKKYKIKQYIQGHYTNNGKDAYIVKNPIWVTENNDYLMYCEKNTICKLCVKSYNIIKKYEIDNKIKLTFYKHSNNYILSNNNLYIHQIITNCFGNGKGTINKSVDHIDRNKLNNIFVNLKIATFKEQQNNRKGSLNGTKRNRQYNAKSLPEGITQNMMPKYIYYCKECYNKEKQLYREFFRIEKHPKLNIKCISSSKSSKLTIHEKLEQIKKKLYNLENDIIEENPNKLPQYYSIQNFRNAPHLTYDRRVEDKRYNLRMKMKSDKTQDEELTRFNEKLRKKYTDLNIDFVY